MPEEEPAFAEPAEEEEAEEAVVDEEADVALSVLAGAAGTVLLASRESVR